MECANDINAMIDAAKFADLVLLLVDGSYGFEMVSLILKWAFIFGATLGFQNMLGLGRFHSCKEAEGLMTFILTGTWITRIFSSHIF